MRTDPDRWHGGHTPKTITPNPQATLIPQDSATRRTTMMEINLGNKAQDRITGYEGTVTAIVHYLSGSTRACIETLGKDGEPQQIYFDIERLELTG